VRRYSFARLGAVAVVASAAACSATAGDVAETRDLNPEVSSTAQELNGVTSAGIAFVRWWDSGTAIGNVTNTGFSQLWSGFPSTANHFPFHAVAGPSVGSGNGSLFTYEYNSQNGKFDLRAKRTNSSGWLVAQWPDPLPAPDDATHLTRTGWGQALQQHQAIFFLNNNTGVGRFFVYTYDQNTQQYSGWPHDFWGSFSGFAKWDVVTAYPADCGVFFYNKTTGAAARGKPNLMGPPPFYTFLSLGTITDPGTGRPYTHVDYTPAGHVFYNATYNYARLIRYNGFTDTIAEQRAIDAPGLGYTHVLGTGNNKAFFYHDGNGTARTVDLTTGALTSTQSGFSTGWTALSRVE
jgi:hypothetical protein